MGKAAEGIMCGILKAIVYCSSICWGTLSKPNKSVKIVSLQVKNWNWESPDLKQEW